MKTIYSILLFFITLALTACGSQMPLVVPATSTYTRLLPTATQTPPPTSTPTLTPTIAPTFPPTPLGNSGKFVYSSCGVNYAHCIGIFSIDLTNNQIERMEDTGVVVSVSPDGKRMYVVQDMEISYVEDLTSSIKYTIPNAKHQFLWLPDNQRIAYLANSGSRWKPNQIYISNWDGSDPKRITTDDEKPAYLLGISKIGNETKLYYGEADPAKRNKPLGIKWINVDTGLKGKVPEDKDHPHPAMDRSVQGNRMACIGGLWYLYLVNLDNSNRMELIRSEDLTKDPPGTLGQYLFWSPDGERLIASARTCQPNCVTAIYIFSTVDGKLLAKSPDFEDLGLYLAGLSPDGKIAVLMDYSVNPNLFIVNLDDFSIEELKPDIPSEKNAFLKTIQWVPIATP